MANCGLLLALAAIWATQITEITSRYAANGSLQVHNYRYNIIDEPHEKVDLKVYYETLCRGCIAFHIGPLDEVLTEMGSYVNFTSYPYGNAKMTKENGTTVVTCQHGELECYGNKLHACAIAHVQDTIKSALYNSCMMSRHWGGKGSTDMDALKCGTSMGVAADEIIRCAQSKEGEDLLEYYGQQTDLVPNRKYVPYIIINGKVFFGHYSKFWAAVCHAVMVCAEGEPYISFRLKGVVKVS